MGSSQSRYPPMPEGSAPLLANAMEGVVADRASRASAGAPFVPGEGGLSSTEVAERIGNQPRSPSAQ